MNDIQAMPGVPEGKIYYMNVSGKADIEKYLKHVSDLIQRIFPITEIPNHIDTEPILDFLSGETESIVISEIIEAPIDPNTFAGQELVSIKSDATESMKAFQALESLSS